MANNNTATNPTTYSPLTIYTLLDDSDRRLPPGHRLCEIGFRYTEKAKARGDREHSSICIALPTIPLTISPPTLQDAVQSAFEKMQDSLIEKTIKERLTAAATWNYLHTTISNDYTTVIGLAALCAAESQTKKGKVSEAEVSSWFSNVLLEPFIAHLLLRNPDATTEKLTQTTNAYSKSLSALTKSNASPPTLKNAILLQEAVNLSIECRVKTSLSAKLSRIINPDVEADLEEALN